MFTFDEIQTLISQGFTHDDIMTLGNNSSPAPVPAPEAPAPAPEPEKEPEPVPAKTPEPVPAKEQEPEPVPEPVPVPAPVPAQNDNTAKILQELSKLTQAIQANAIAQSNNKIPHTMTDEEAMAQILNPVTHKPITEKGG